MSTFNSKSMLLDRQHIQSVFTDSCTQAAGGIYQGGWFYINWACCIIPTHKLQGDFGCLSSSVSLGPILEKLTNLHTHR